MVDRPDVIDTRLHWRTLLVLLLAAVLVRPVLGDGPVAGVLQPALFWLIFAGTIEAAQLRGPVRIAGQAATAVWIALQFANAFVDARPLDIAVTTASVLLAMGVIAITFALLARTEEVDFDTLLGAVYGYLLIAVAFAFVYAAAEVVSAGAFDFGGGGVSFSTFVYFSLVTMTTLGYGDIQPLGDFVRLLAGLQALFGTLYFAVFIGTIAGKL